MKNMTNLEIFKTKQESNKCLKKLTETEKLLIIQMMDEARELGYDKGIEDANSKKLVECRNCGDTVEMVSSGEFCPKCFCE